jgi:hypothetical protein
MAKTAKPVSPEGQIRRLRATNRRVERMRREACETLARVGRERDDYRARATKAEREAAEWKRRFDALLAKPWARVEEPAR